MNSFLFLDSFSEFVKNAAQVLERGIVIAVRILRMIHLYSLQGNDTDHQIFPSFHAKVIDLGTWKSKLPPHA
jgi:hypothetical protein